MLTIIRIQAERKGHTEAEVDGVIVWLTGWDMATVNMEMIYGVFFDCIPA